MSPTASPLSSDASTSGAAAGSGRVGGATGTTAGAARAAGDALMTFLAAGGLACCSGAGWLFSCGAVQGVRVLRGWEGAKVRCQTLAATLPWAGPPYPQVQWLRRTCLAARTLAVATLALTLVAVVFLVVFLVLALVGVLVGVCLACCLAFSEVGAALGARGFLAAGASSSAATRRVGAERARFDTRCAMHIGRGRVAVELEGVMRRTNSPYFSRAD